MTSKVHTTSTIASIPCDGTAVLRSDFIVRSEMWSEGVNLARECVLFGGGQASGWADLPYLRSSCQISPSGATDRGGSSAGPDEPIQEQGGEGITFVGLVGGWGGGGGVSLVL